MTSHPLRRLVVIACMPLALTLGARAQATPPQSRALSEASGASLEASVQVPIAAFEALRASGHFSVVAVQTVARGTVVTIVASGVTISVLTTALIEPDFNFISGHPGTSIGKVMMGSAGLLLKVGEKVLAFIPEPRVRPHIHSRKLEP